MTHRRIRQLVLLVGAPGVVGLWIALVVDDLDVGIPVLLASGVAAGLVSSSRARLVGPYASGGPEVPLRHRRRSVAVDVAVLSALALGLALVFTFVAVAQGEDDATIWLVAPVLAVLAGGSALLGALVGLLVVVPLVTLAGLALGRGRGAPRRSEVLTCVLLPVIVAFATLLSLAVDGPGRPRARVISGLVPLLTGRDTDAVTITSQPLLWAARVALVALVVLVVALVRATRSEARPS